ncbi:MAG: GNAT family N-acetyltransferase [Microbacterium sp.]
MRATRDEPVIRLVRPDEFERAGAVTVEAYRHSYGEISTDYAASLADVAGRVRDGDVWIADEHGEILGTVWVARAGERLAEVAQPGETDFRQLAVGPAARGRGVGVALVRHVIALARARGSHRVVLNSGVEMTAAHALYERLGFRRLPERERPVEVRPGEWVELLAFGYDVSEAPASSSHDR